jgi:hypothetical protein
MLGTYRKVGRHSDPLPLLLSVLLLLLLLALLLPCRTTPWLMT